MPVYGTAVVTAQRFLRARAAVAAKVSADGDRRRRPLPAVVVDAPRQPSGPENEWVIRWQRERAITGIT